MLLYDITCNPGFHFQSGYSHMSPVISGASVAPNFGASTVPRGGFVCTDFCDSWGLNDIRTSKASEILTLPLPSMWEVWLVPEHRG